MAAKTQDNTQHDAIFNAAQICLERFEMTQDEKNEGIVTKLFKVESLSVGDSPESSRQSCLLELRTSFILWADYTGALAARESSLDARLEDLPELSSMVLELLEMISRNLNRFKSQFDDIANIADTVLEIELGDALGAIDYALNQLHYLGSAIRNASAKRLEYSVTSYLSEEDLLFRRYATALVKRSFPKALSSLHEHLGDTIAVRRKSILRSIRHTQNLSKRQEQDIGASALPQPGPAMELVPRTPSSIANESTVTKASEPNLQTPAFRAIYDRTGFPVLSATTTSIITSVSLAFKNSFEYPECPQTENASHIKCPYCLKGLATKNLNGPNGIKYWRSHLDEDLQPYVCLFPECVENLVFFRHQKEWLLHMENHHSADWPQRVHNVTWYCDIGHDPVMKFQNQVDWKAHMQKPGAHSPIRPKPPTDTQLRSLSRRKQQAGYRDKHLCLFCEAIPPDIVRALEQGTVCDLPMMLKKHIAEHIKSVSLISLPFVDDEYSQSEQSSSRFKNSSFNRGSKPQKLSEPVQIDRPSADYPSLSFSSSRAPSVTEIPVGETEPGPSTTKGPHQLEGDSQLDELWNAIRETKFITDEEDLILTAFRSAKFKINPRTDPVIDQPLRDYTARDYTARTYSPHVKDFNKRAYTERTYTQRSRTDYKVGWICVLPVEMTAAEAMLDHTHIDTEDTVLFEDDGNKYVLGSIGGYNVVISCSVSHLYSEKNGVALQMIRSFPAIQFYLTVGIASGIPDYVRLGDVVVAQPTNGLPAVVEYDVGRFHDFNFVENKSTDKFPTLFSKALSRLKSDPNLDLKIQIGSVMDEARENCGLPPQSFSRPQDIMDILFASDYIHVAETDEYGDFQYRYTDSCSSCDMKHIVKRETEASQYPRVHYGSMLATDRFIRSAELRDEVGQSFGVKCIDCAGMALGSPSIRPYLHIRGICDYADSHRNKIWQEYAAGAAAAFTKILIGYI